MYNRDKKDPMKVHVEEALAKYKGNVYECGAGYAILRYAIAGLISVDETVSAKEFVEWYSRNPSYVILRLALQGKLYYKEQ